MILLGLYAEYRKFNDIPVHYCLKTMSTTARTGLPVVDSKPGIEHPISRTLFAVRGGFFDQKESSTPSR